MSLGREDLRVTVLIAVLAVIVIAAALAFPELPHPAMLQDDRAKWVVGIADAVIGLAGFAASLGFRLTRGPRGRPLAAFVQELEANLAANS